MKKLGDLELRKSDWYCKRLSEDVQWVKSGIERFHLVMVFTIDLRQPYQNTDT